MEIWIVDCAGRYAESPYCLKNDGFAAYNFHGEMMSEEQIITRMQSDYHLYPYIKGTMNIELHQYDGEYEIDLRVFTMMPERLS